MFSMRSTLELAAQAAELDVAPTHYGSPDSLRRRYEEAKKRMAD